MILPIVRTADIAVLCMNMRGFEILRVTIYIQTWINSFNILHFHLRTKVGLYRWLRALWHCYWMMSHVNAPTLPTFGVASRHDRIMKWKHFPRYWPIVIGAFDVFFDLRLNKRLGRQSRYRLFETPFRSIRCHVNGNTVYNPRLIFIYS